MSIVTSYAIGFGIVVVLSFLFFFFLKGDFTTLLGFMLMFSGFVVWGGLLDMWVVVLLLIVYVVDIILEFSMKRGGFEG